MTLERMPDGEWLEMDHNCDVPPIKPSVASLARDQVERLVPRPGIGVGPPGGVTLVNIQTLFWLDTAVTRSLGTVQLLGQPVELRVIVSRVAWNFGDGTTAETTGPGTPYTNADPCHTALCPGYFGHVYTATGARTVSAIVTWIGSYRVSGGAWQVIANNVTGPGSTVTLTVKQARGILVPDPN